MAETKYLVSKIKQNKSNMAPEIKIIEKPNWVSWDDIRQCLIDAHSVNRAMGINMTHYQWPANRIRESLGKNGFMLVALDGRKLVGTAGIGEKYGRNWYVRGRCYAYMCFAGVLPQYSGKGIFKMLEIKREELAKQYGYDILVGDTHANNKHRLDMALNNGFRLVRYFRATNGDHYHYSVVYVKWLSGCPYSDKQINRYYRLSWLLVRLKYNKRGEERSRITTAICRRLNNRLKVL